MKGSPFSWNFYHLCEKVTIYVKKRQESWIFNFFKVTISVKFQPLSWKNTEDPHSWNAYQPLMWNQLSRKLANISHKSWPKHFVTLGQGVDKHFLSHHSEVDDLKSVHDDLKKTWWFETFGIPHLFVFPKIRQNARKNNTRSCRILEFLCVAGSASIANFQITGPKFALEMIHETKLCDKLKGNFDP